MSLEITIKEPSEIQYLQVLVLARYMALDLSNTQRSQFIVALEREKMVGFIRLKKKKDLMELATLGVVKDYRKKGIARKLLGYFTEKYPNLYMVTCTPKKFETKGFTAVSEVPECLQSKFNNTALWAGYGDPVVMVSNSHKD